MGLNQKEDFYKRYDEEKEKDDIDYNPTNSIENPFKNNSEALNIDNNQNNISSNQIFSENKHQRQNKFITTKPSTSSPSEQELIIDREQVKKEKGIYGKIGSYKTFEKEIPNPTNKFFINHRLFYDLVYRYFSKNPSSFISERAIRLRATIIDFGQKLINTSITKNPEDANPNELIAFLSYDKFCKCNTKEFNKRNLGKSLKEIFSDTNFQYERNDENHNKNLINLLCNKRERSDNKIANEYLELTFYELVKEFTKAELDNYLENEAEDLRKVYIENNINDYEERIEAYKTIIRTLCENFKEYSLSFEERKYKAKNKKMKK